MLEGTFLPGQTSFTDVPDDPSGDPIGIDLKRATCGRPIVAYSLSERVVGKFTHYYRRRTVPCDGDQCQMCLEKSPKRWLGYIVLFDEATQKPFMVELTLAAARQLTRDFPALASMRGCFIEVARMGKRSNGRVVSQKLARNSRSEPMVQCPDVPRILNHMWACPDRQLRLLDDSLPSEILAADSLTPRKIG